jgi:hypothetical protein
VGNFGKVQKSSKKALKYRNYEKFHSKNSKANKNFPNKKNLETITRKKPIKNDWPKIKKLSRKGLANCRHYNKENCENWQE